MTAGVVDIGRLYGQSRKRTYDLVTAAPDDVGRIDVDACPGWTVHCVIAHLVGIIEDAAAGRIHGLPEPSQTAEQIRRHEADDLTAMLEQWTVMSPIFEQALTDRQIWPAVFDVMSHELDIRTALGDTRERNNELVNLAARLLANSVDPSLGFSVRFDDGSRPVGVAAESAYVLSTTPFEFFRMRLGRRSHDQIRAMTWSQDPSLILNRLTVFPARTTPFVE